MTSASPFEARVPLLERGQVPPEIAALYDTLLATRGVVPNMFKALSSVPALAVGIAALLKPLMGEGALPGWYKELIATRVAWLNDCAYCVSAHRHLALQRGASAEQVASLVDETNPEGEAKTVRFETGPFTEKEKAGLRYAGLLHVSGNAIDETAFEAVSAHFGPEELVELTAVAAAFEMFPRFNSGLRIPVTPLPEE
jgi:AhpD family alkylhydroperoxidase